MRQRDDWQYQSGLLSASISMFASTDFFVKFILVQKRIHKHCGSSTKIQVDPDRFKVVIFLNETFRRVSLIAWDVNKPSVDHLLSH
jgi:hypothetical protein